MPHRAIAFDLGRLVAEADWGKGISHRRKSVNKNTELGGAWGMYRQ